MDKKEVKKAWKIYNKECKKVKAPTVTLDEYISMLPQEQESYDANAAYDPNQQQVTYDANVAHDPNQQQEVVVKDQENQNLETNQIDTNVAHDPNQQQEVVVKDQETQNLETSQIDTNVEEQATNSLNSDVIDAGENNLSENGEALPAQNYSLKEIKKAWKIYRKECKKTKSPFLSLDEYTESLNQQQSANVSQNEDNNQNVLEAQNYSLKEIKKAWKIYRKECKKTKSPFLSLDEYTKSLNEQPQSNISVNEQQENQNLEINNQNQIDSSQVNAENIEQQTENNQVNEDISVNENSDMIDINENNPPSNDPSQIYSGNTIEEISKSFAASEIKKINNLSKDANYSENNSELFSVIKATTTFSEFIDSSINSTKKIKKASLYDANDQKNQLGDLKKRLTDSRRNNSRKSFDTKNAKNSFLISQKYKSFNSSGVNKNKIISERLEARKEEFLKKNTFYNKDKNKLDLAKRISSSPTFSSQKIRGFGSNSEKIKTM
ncbi:MAG: hypothetical protein ACRCW6_03210 [Mycoplasmoidaceae bacterium]